MINMVVKTGKMFWKEMEKGTKVTFCVQGKLETYNLLYERMEYSNDYGEDMWFMLFQKTMEDMGNPRIGHVFIMEKIKVKFVNGVSVETFYKEKKKELRKQKKVATMTQPERVRKIKETVKIEETKPIQVTHGRMDHGFTITTKDGKYFCPCGNEYGRRDTAVFVHKKRHLHSE